MLARVIIHKISGRHYVDANIDGRIAQASYETPTQARQAAIDIIQQYDEGKQHPAEILADYQ